MKIGKYFNLSLVIFSVVFFTSCAIFDSRSIVKSESAVFSEKVEKLQKGMTKREVINILGNDYIVIREGAYDAVLKKSVEIIRYPRKHPEKSYSIRFANGRLYDISRI